MAKQYSKRDFKGDLKFDYKTNPERNRYWDFTYVFKYYDERNSYKKYTPYFDLEWGQEEKLDSARKKKDFVERRLYAMPDNPPFDHEIKYHNWMLSLLVGHFKEVFDERAFQRGFIPQNKFFRVILKKPIDDIIQNLIKKYQLEKVQDLIYEIISISQHVYTEDVSMYDTKEYANKIKGIKSEVTKLFQVIDRKSDRTWIMAGKKPPPELMSITFHYGRGNIVLSDPMLIGNIIEEFKHHLQEGFYKNWKLELEKYTSYYSIAEKKLNFKFDLALSLFSFLRTFPQFRSKEKTPNKVVSCIVEILELCLIPMGSEGNSLTGKMKVVRHWLERKKIEKEITHLTIKANNKRLLKYFDPEFIAFGSDKKELNILLVAGRIVRRFGLDLYKKDIAHIIQCVKKFDFVIDAQMALMSQSSGESPKEFTPFLELYKVIKNKGKIDGFKFTTPEGSEYSFTDRMPLFIIEEALKAYFKTHHEDFEVDLIKRTSVQSSGDQVKIIREPAFHLPEERFMVKFTNSFFNYLLNEIPPKESEFLPSEKYYAIIAATLQQSWFFNHLNDPEELVMDKVKAWHKLAQSKNPS